MRINVFKSGGNSAQGGFVSNGLTLQGPLILSGPHSEPLHAVPKQYVDNVAYNLDAANITSGVLTAARMPAFSGDASTILGSSNIILSNTGVTPGSIIKPTVDAKGRITGGSSIVESDLTTVSFAKINVSKPTTIDGFGISNAVNTDIDSTINGNLILHTNPVNNEHAATKQYTDAAAGQAGGISIGDIIRKPYNTTPTGFLKCNGGEVDKTTYASLYSVIGDSFALYTNIGAGRPWQQQYQINENQNSDLVGWTTGTALPSVMSHHSSIVTKNRVYMFGGYNGSAWTSVVYTAPINTDGTLGTWVSATSLPGVLGGSSSIVTKNRVYLIGGYNGSAYTGNVFTAPINSDGTLGAWSSVTNLPGAVVYSAAITIQNKVYLIGGHNGSSYISTIYTATINSDGTIGTWSVFGSYPLSISYASVAVIRNKLYVFGGTSSVGYLSHVYYADISVDGTLGSWNSGIYLPVNLTTSSVYVTKYKVYLVGGGNSVTLNTIYSATINSDGTLGAWSLSGTLPGVLSVSNLIATKNRVYVYGGSNASTHTNALYTTSIDGGLNDYSSYYGASATDSYIIAGGGKPWQQQYQINTTQSADITGWTTGTSLPGLLGTSSVVVTKNRVYLLGGETDSATVSTVYTTPINSDGTLGTWATDTALPVALKHSQAVVTKNRVYLIGGIDGGGSTTNIWTAVINSDGTLGAWVISSLLLPIITRNFGTLITKNRLYLFGGNNDSGSLSTVYTANINTDGTLGGWSTDIPLPSNVSYGQVIATNNRVYLCGGYNGSAAISTVYTAPINSNGTIGTWTTSASLPGNLYTSQAIVTKNRAYILSGQNGSVYLNTVYTAPINSDGTLGAWTTGTSLPGNIGTSQAIITKNRIYLLGGQNTTNRLSTVYTASILEGLNDYSPYYDGTNDLPDTDINYLMPGSGRPWQQQYQINNTQSTNITGWATGTALPGVLANSSVIVTKNRVYLLGGYNGSSNVSTVYTAPINADGTLGTWTTGTSIPGVLANSVSIVTNNRAYLLGGMNTPSTYVSTVYTAPINSDGTLGTWTTGTSLPSNFSYSTVIITKNRIHLCGGHNGSNHSSTVYTAPINTDGMLGSWIAGPSLPGILTFSSGIVTKNRVYLAGGFNGSAHVATVYTAPINSDGTLGTWTTGTSIPGVLSRSQAIVTKNRAYLLGGDGNQSTFVSTVYTAPINPDGTLGAWASGTSLPGGLCLSQAIVTKNKVYLLGGYTGASTVISTVYTANISSDIQDYSPYYDGTIQPVSSVSTKFKLPDYTLLDKEFGGTVTSYIKF